VNSRFKYQVTRRELKSFVQSSRAILSKFPNLEVDNHVKEKPERSNKVQSINTIVKRIVILLSIGYILMFSPNFDFFGEISPMA
jgi:hypothetical protein